MTRELVYVETVKSLSPIAGADRIEKAQVLGWELVVKKGDFKVGDLCVYAEIDSVFPEQHPCFEFLKPRKMRIKTVKLRGQVSQGICFPISILKEVNPNFDLSTVKAGMPCTELLGVIKYDSEAASDVKRIVNKKSWIQNKLSYLKWKLFGRKPIENNDFPQDVPKTDEERVQKFGHHLEKCEGQLVYITEKLEGASATFVYRQAATNWLAKLLGKNNLFQICSRNRVVWDSEEGGDNKHHIYLISQKYDIYNKLKKLGRNLAIQGEAIGSENGSRRIQSDIYRLNELQFLIFLMYDLDKKEYLSFSEVKEIARQCQFETVPLLQMNVPLVNSVQYYVELSKGQSIINPSLFREGVVIRAVDNSFSFKSINPDYLILDQLGLNA